MALPGGDTWIEPLSGAELVRIPGGIFPMGYPDGRDNERPPHEVSLPPFYLGRFEMTRGQWIQVMGTDPSHFPECAMCPVEQVSWEDAVAFLAKVRERTKLPLRLPTEAEWEYAAGGGALHQVWPGTDDRDVLGDHVWFKGQFEGRVHPAGQKDANVFGLHDMGGNVAEWCSDWYDEGYYAVSPVDDPAGPDAGQRRVLRGGAFISSADAVRTARRSASAPDTRRRTIGFRVALDAE